MADRSVLVRLRADISQFNRQMAAAGATTNAFIKDLESADGRMANLVQTVLALAPALVPIGGAAVTAIAGLATQLGFAAAGAGTTVLAFNGVFDALDALNKFQLEPTEANLRKVNDAFAELSPAAGEFVLFLDEIEPKLESIQRTAANGLLPGAQEGLEEFLRLTPQVRRIVSEIATTTGDLLAEAGDNLNDERWRDFFRFIEQEARPVLLDLGHTTGNIVEGLANMFMELNPLADQFGEGLLEASQNFAEWSANLDSNEGFQEFLDYLERTGPKAMDTLGALVDMFAALVAAAAPVGEATLPVITALAKVIEAIAESPAGPVLIATAAGLSAVSRAMALYQAANGSALGTSTGTLTMDGNGAGLGANAAAAGLGVLALSLTDFDEKLGLSNTAMFAMIGLLAGPWGAAVGASIGLMKDMSAVTGDLDDALGRISSTSGSGSLQAQADAVDNLGSSLERLVDIDLSTPAGILKADLLGIQNAFTLGGTVDKIGDAGQKYRKAAADAQDFRTAIQLLNYEINPEKRDEWATFGFTLADLQRVYDRLGPAARAAGIDLDTALKAGAGSPEWLRLVDAVRRYKTETEGARGSSKAVGDALVGLQDELMATADSATALQTALDSLFGIQLSQSEATDAWTQSLKDLRGQIRESGAALVGNSQIALDNREAIRSSVEALQEKVVADARAGVSGDQLVTSLLQGRDAIIAAGTAAGASAEQVEAYLTTLGMTPENMVTIFTTPGLLTAKQQTQALAQLYDLTPKEVRTLIAQLGMAKSQADIKALAEQYHLTPKQVRTLIEANAAGAFAAIAAVRGQLDDLDGKTANTYVITRRISTGTPPGQEIPKADGGLMVGPGGPRDDAIPAWVSNGEYVVKAAAVEKYGIAMFDDINAMRLAGGGLATRGGSVGTFSIGGPGLARLDKTADTAAKSLKKHADEVDRDRQSIRDRIQELRQERSSFKDTVAGSFQHDIFGNGLAGAMTQLQADTNDANSMRAALKKAKKLGLSGSAFEALAGSGDLSTAQDLDTRKEIRQFEKAFEGRASATGGLAGFAGEAVFGKAIDRLTDATHRQSQTLKDLDKRLGGLEDAVQRGAARGTRAGMDANNRTGYGLRGN